MLGCGNESFDYLYVWGQEDDALVPAAPSVPVRELYQLFWPYNRLYPRWPRVSLLLVMLAPAIDTLTIWLFKILVDDVLVPVTSACFSGWRLPMPA